MLYNLTDANQLVLTSVTLRSLGLDANVLQLFGHTIKTSIQTASYYRCCTRLH
jgi:hypothetical protein